MIKSYQSINSISDASNYFLHVRNVINNIEDKETVRLIHDMFCSLSELDSLNNTKQKISGFDRDGILTQEFKDLDVTMSLIAYFLETSEEYYDIKVDIRRWSYTKILDVLIGSRSDHSKFKLCKKNVETSRFFIITDLYNHNIECPKFVENCINKHVFEGFVKGA